MDLVAHFARIFKKIVVKFVVSLHIPDLRSFITLFPNFDASSLEWILYLDNSSSVDIALKSSDTSYLCVHFNTIREQNIWK